MLDEERHGGRNQPGYIFANAADGADVTEDMVKVYSAETLEELKTALPLDQGVAVETKSAVKTTIKATAPQGAKSRFLRVEYGNK